MRSQYLALAVVALLLLGCQQAPASKSRELPAALQQYVLDQVPAELEQPTLIDFEGKVHLVGAALAAKSPVGPGEQLQLTLYWKPVEKLGPGWSLFTHLVDHRGRRVDVGEDGGTGFSDVGPLRRREQADGPQALPPSQWVVGKVYRDEQQLTVPDVVTAAEHTLLVGIGQEYKLAATDVADAPGSGDEAEADDDEDEGEDDDEDEGEDDDAAAAQRRSSRAMRLRVISGPCDGENRGVVGHFKTRAKPPAAEPKEKRQRKPKRRAGRRRGERRMRGFPGEPRQPRRPKPPAAKPRGVDHP